MPAAEAFVVVLLVLVLVLVELLPLHPDAQSANPMTAITSMKWLHRRIWLSLLGRIT
jgi:hypothetical protein